MKKNQPLAMFTLNVPRNHKLIVYIWPTLKAMRARISKLPGAGSKRTTIGFFYAPRTRIKIGKRNVVQRKIVGQIHLHLDKGRIGAGVFAHELQHFISWWCAIKEYDLIGKDWERVPKLAGNLTKKFWQFFYEWEETRSDK